MVSKPRLSDEIINVFNEFRHVHIHVISPFSLASVSAEPTTPDFDISSLIL